MALRNGRAHVTARVGVDLPTHQRFLRIERGNPRAEALGVWTAATCYSRGKELDGFCPLEGIEAYASDEVITRLVDVGLFARHEKDGVHGVQVLRFDEFNETKEDINKRLRADRVRKKRKRVQKSSDRNTAGNPADYRRTRGDGDGDGDLSLSSPLGSGSSLPSETLLSTGAELEPATGVRMPQSTHAHTGTIAITGDSRVVRRTDTLTDELRAAAEMLGLRDVDLSWAAFTGQYDGQPRVSVPGAWQTWAAKDAQRQKTQRASGKIKLVQQDDPAFEHSWEMGEKHGGK